ncbi:tail fiber domain-containing protein [Paraburkholderia caballeronis]|uniref:Chaperone of endosialidase n=1 Tax=Paraburkholderia caballeronis TaxID=416943 RepID=A0A1H7L1P3_9BURK|nr:tail fiber domain-containing protein [Paraburkholderia caballeronis]PXW28259.1 endosialidase-like protein [Paraburkholderia caballeronis]PXX03625.1 endosialidase-like protein [Paraburkholderia caballeronis]RAK04369.1 endosialidase-like protein [Paraburkholderia caballeronis]SED82968.1 Chaperone of endosialidase [Paraburkholderia caballeronis]SEK92983.1 Chaperone of endosialidase [Paraburkholderia caballeronis]
MRHNFELPDLPLRAFGRAPFRNRPATLEGGKGGSAPQAPDPYQVAGATTQTNEDTAAYNKALNLNNYSNPFGSQTTTQTGTDPNTGAPIYNTSISASPQLSQALGAALSQAGNSTAINQQALAGIQGLTQSIDPNAAQQAAQQGTNAMYQQQMAYLQPQQQQQTEMTQAQLANQGLTPGSEAYDNAMGNLTRSQTFANSQAMDSAISQGQQLGINQLNAQQGVLGQLGSLYGYEANLGQLPYSELGSLASLVPGYTGTASSSASPANIAQAFQNQYQGQLNAYNADVASSNSTMNGLFGLGGAGILALSMSDRRLKTDVKRIGTADNGLPLYRFRYLWDAPGRAPHVGVMADEVRSIRPGAVMRLPNGYDAVNYDAALEV